MNRSLLICLIGLVFTGCRTTLKEYMVESSKIYQDYVEGDIHTAKAAMVSGEKLIAKMENEGNHRVDFHQSYFLIYGRLCAIHEFLGDRDLAEDYYRRAMKQRNLMAHANQGDDSMQSLLESIQEYDEALPPKWRNRQ